MNITQIYNRRKTSYTWSERMMQKFGMDMTSPIGKGELTIPVWLTGKTLVFFFVALFACWGALGYVPEFDIWLVASMSVVLFLYGGQSLSGSWSRKKERIFVKNVFIAGLIIRLVWVLYCYFVFNPAHYGLALGDNADVEWYMPFGKDLTLWLSGNSKYNISQIIDMNGAAIDDVGYPMWLAIIYFIVGVENDVFVPFVIKCIVGAYCAVCIYRVAQRHYGEGVGRMAAIFVALNPNMIYWCGTMMKETEMVFCVCLAIDNFDRVLYSGKSLTFKNLIPGISASIALMFFRSALGIVIFLAVFAHIVMASNKVMSYGKKIIAGILVMIVLLLSVGDRLREQSKQLYSSAQSDLQQTNMEWRSTRSGGNSFAKYASATMFAPLIFTIPFPTFNQANEYQIAQVLLSGGSYIKNILSYFVIMVMFLMLISGEWRKHVYIIAFTVGYLIVLIMSPFAQSGRFHMPVLPMLMLFAAYGVQIAKRNIKLRRWFSYALVIEFVACLAWNWFKLKGRGMV